ncbi:MAG: TolC family protein [Bacteroidetes bacterium]|nr:TolC family protein [Bacteroidota bacterium]
MKLVCTFSLLFIFQLVIFGQDNPPNGNYLTIVQAIQLGEKQYPFLKSKSYEVEAAKKNIDLSKNTFVPSLDISYQANIATANNITGMFYPSGMIPISGPVFSSNNYNAAFGTAASLLLNWQPLTFGQRTAQINTSKAETAVKNADYENEIFKHKIKVISDYLDVLLAQELLVVYEKNIDRSIFNLKESRTLAVTGLRPGVDTAIFIAELSKSNIDLISAKNFLQLQKISLSELIARDTAFILTDTLLFTKLPTPNIDKDSSLNQHPAMKLSQSQLDLSRSREALLKTSWLPKLNVWGTTFARGSGIYPDGSIKAADGLGFSRYNYGLGLQATFPILKYSEIHLQRQQQDFVSKSNLEMQNQIYLQLSKQRDAANLNLQKALAITKETPVQYQSAKYAFDALQIRYNTGLVNFAELIQAQYNLVKAENDLRKSYWEAWKALLYKSAVTGDLNIFLNESK